jgi:hypothetical protein
MSLSVVKWLQLIGVPVSETTQQNLDNERVDVRAIMGLNDDQLRELGFSMMGHRSTIQEQRRPHPLVAASLQPTSATCLQPSPAPAIAVVAVARRRLQHRQQDVPQLS